MIKRSPIARVPFISRSRRIRDYQDSSETLKNPTLPSRPRTRSMLGKIKARRQMRKTVNN